MLRLVGKRSGPVTVVVFWPGPLRIVAFPIHAVLHINHLFTQRRAREDDRQQQNCKPVPYLHPTLRASLEAILRIVATVMSSFWPHALAASAISCADLPLMSRVRSKPKSSRLGFSASTTPSEMKVNRLPVVVVSG